MRHSLPVPSIFESFNARALEPHQVAKTFVPSQHYRTLAKRAHTIIVGPRGSGKTTLLKMLQQPALEAWTHPDAESFRQSIDFTGVFVATDVSWGAQLSALGQGQLDEESHRVLGIAAFTTHVLRALVIAMQNRVHGLPDSAIAGPHRRVALPPEKEVRMVKHMAESLYLKPALLTLLAMKQSLTRRMADIHTFANKEIVLGLSERKERVAALSYAHLHFLTSLSVCTEAFEDESGVAPDRWALLFDELELAPRWIREELFRSLRSADSRFLFKLSMSPYNDDTAGLDQSMAATPGNDYDEIPLWYAHKEDGAPFCHVLWESMLKERQLPNAPPEEVLGRSEFETLTDEWVDAGTAYSPGSRLQKRVARAAQHDPSFAEYLREKDIDVNDLHNLEGDTRAADIRKVAPLLVVRESFRSVSKTSEHESRQITRSRKNPKIYAGASSLFAIVEGNPRWFIGIVGRLLESLRARHVAPARQAKEVAATSDRFAAMLRTIPCPVSLGRRTTDSILGVLDRVGHFIFGRVVLDDFTSDPAGSFTVDAHISEDVLVCLGRALNAGALVYVPDEMSGVIVQSLRGKRFRLSYLLAPRYHIPLRLGRDVSLSFILSEESKKKSAGPEASLYDEVNNDPVN